MLRTHRVSPAIRDGPGPVKRSITVLIASDTSLQVPLDDPFTNKISPPSVKHSILASRLQPSNTLCIQATCSRHSEALSIESKVEPYFEMHLNVGLGGVVVGVVVTVVAVVVGVVTSQFRNPPSIQVSVIAFRAAAVSSQFAAS